MNHNAQAQVLLVGIGSGTLVYWLAPIDKKKDIGLSSTTPKLERITKSMIGSVIQQSVLDGEFSSKEALQWLTDADNPNNDVMKTFNQLPLKLQERIFKNK